MNKTYATVGALTMVILLRKSHDKAIADLQ